MRGVVCAFLAAQKVLFQSKELKGFSSKVKNLSKGGTDHRKVKIRFVYNDIGCNGKDYKRNQENHSTKGRRSTVKL